MVNPFKKTLERGTIISWNTDGTGRIRADNGGQIIYFYWSPLKGLDHPSVGQRVDFSRMWFGLKRHVANFVVPILSDPIQVGGGVTGDDDWRLNGQERYLKGLSFARRRWRETRSGWDHDHCEFCNAKFAEFDGPDILHEGWTTPDDLRWICDTCFTDFRDRFEWQAVE